MASTGLVFWIARFAVHDGPGIRVTVFLKGCPLRCAWCHSPESQSPKPELLLKEDRCIVCGTCVPICTRAAIAQADAAYATDRARCEACGDCVEACPAEARTLAGQVMTVEALVAEIAKDRTFIERSGGGVTFSGGEPLMQPEFLREAVAACRAEGWHTAVETSGYGTPPAVAAAATADLVLFDLKVYDEAEHRRMTGVSNRLILENFKRVAGWHRDVRVRVPLVPGLTDEHGNIDAIGRLARSVGVARVDLLPYHTAGLAKYDRLGRPYGLPNTAPPSVELLAATRDHLERLGLTVHVGG